MAPPRGLLERSGPHISTNLAVGDGGYWGDRTQGTIFSSFFLFGDDEVKSASCVFYYGLGLYWRRIITALQYDLRLFMSWLVPQLPLWHSVAPLMDLESGYQDYAQLAQKLV